MSQKITDAMIKHMSYKERQDHYIQEKNALFERIRHMTAEKVRDAHDALVKKWRV